MHDCVNETTMWQKNLFKSWKSRGKLNKLCRSYTEFYFNSEQLFSFIFVSLVYSPNAICYKIGEKICDQFNNAFILMVSDVPSCSVCSYSCLQSVVFWEFFLQIFPCLNILCKFVFLFLLNFFWSRDFPCPHIVLFTPGSRSFLGAVVPTLGGTFSVAKYYQCKPAIVFHILPSPSLLL